VDEARATVSRAAGLDLGDQVVARMRTQLPVVAERTVAAVIAEVPGYSGPPGPGGPDRETLEQGVEMALRGFLTVVSTRRDSDSSSPMAPALDAAYALGRGEAGSGRSMDALLAAYRVGARVAWRELAGAAVAEGLTAQTMVSFAELVFAYIDELSAASLVGHADQLATTGRVRQRYLERLAHSLLVGAPSEQLATAADRADWEPPEQLIAVILPESQVRSVLPRLDPRTLQPVEELPGLPGTDQASVLLVAAGGQDRAPLIRSLGAVPAIVGSSRPWTQVDASYERALHARRLGLGAAGGPVDTDLFLPEIVLGADPDALGDLRARVLAPIRALRPDPARRLTDTLRSWLLHSGRRDAVAADLVVHPQTVRYRMGQVRDLYGDRLNEPRTILELTIALGVPPGPSGPSSVRETLRPRPPGGTRASS
jgi:PucR C-terminal helix-turn-helix domain